MCAALAVRHCPTCQLTYLVLPLLSTPSHPTPFPPLPLSPAALTDFQAVQLKVASMTAAIASSRLLVSSAAQQADCKVGVGGEGGLPWAQISRARTVLI